LALLSSSNLDLDIAAQRLAMDDVDSVDAIIAMGGTHTHEPTTSFTRPRSPIAESRTETPASRG
jgi:protein-tyrosine-phosphatase